MSLSSWELELEALREDEMEVAARLRRSSERTTILVEPVLLPEPPVDRRRLAAASTAVQALVRALGRVAEPADYSTLVLACWQCAPDRFGLPGWETHHPDSHRVSAALYGRHGAIGRGLVEGVAGEAKRFRRTRLGKAL